jgi:hypothetical protein
MNDRYEKGHIDLLDTRVRKTKQYRFVTHSLIHDLEVIHSTSPFSFVVLDAQEQLELENKDST